MESVTDPRSKKATNCANVYIMESDSLDDFDIKRKGVRGFTTDQGPERGIGDETVRVIPEYKDRYSAADPRVFMWPWALFIMGHLHLLFNALEEACKGLSISSKFFDQLSDICAFLNDADLRRKFQFECLPDEAARSKFASSMKQHIDWRWEFLCAACKAVLERWELLCRYFDMGKMTRSEAGRLDRKVLKAMKDIMEDKLFPLLCAIFLAIGSVIEKCASRLEGCECHQHVWTKKRKWSAKLAEVRESTGYDHCVWKGRQAAWWVAVGLEQCLRDIQSASSDTLDQMMHALDDVTKAQAVQLLEQLRTKLGECVTDKMSFWTHIPWRIVGVYHCCLGGSIER